jgi:hypothetical protein
VISCEHARSLIDRSALDDVPAAERGMLREHLASCVACAAEFGAFSRLLDELATLPDVAPSPQLDTRIYEAIIADRRRRSGEHGFTSLWRQILRGAMRTTGTLLVTIVVVALLSGAFVFAASNVVHDLAPIVGLVPPTPQATLTPTVRPTPTAAPALVVTNPPATPRPTPTTTPAPTERATAVPTPSPTPSPTPTATPAPTIIVAAPTVSPSTSPSASPSPSPAPSTTPKPRRCPPGTPCYSPSPTPGAASTPSP